MGFWSTVGEIILKGLEAAGEKATESKEKYDSSYDRYSERYSDMSDDKLKREAERLSREAGGNPFERMGKLQAMRDELDNRKG